MSDLYRLYPVAPINVAGKGELAPTGYVSPEQRAIWERQTAPYSAPTESRVIIPMSRVQSPHSPAQHLQKPPTIGGRIYA